MVTTEANFIKSTNARIAKAISGATPQNLEQTLTQIDEALSSLDERVASLEVKVNTPSLDPIQDNLKD